MLPEFRYKDCTSLWLCCFVASWHPGLEVDKAKPRDNAASDFQELTSFSVVTEVDIWTRGMVGQLVLTRTHFRLLKIDNHR